MKIEDQYRAAAGVWTDIQDHLPRLVNLAIELNAKRVIELGVRFGTSTVAWLYAMEQTKGHLWSVDIIQQWIGIESDRWTFVEADDTHPVTREMLPDNADIVFIDTSHEYQHTLDELDLYLQHLRPGGAFVLHDTNVERFDHHTPGSQPAFPVRQAVEDFKTMTLDRMNVVYREEYYPESYGLTILRF